MPGLGLLSSLLNWAFFITNVNSPKDDPGRNHLLQLLSRPKVRLVVVVTREAAFATVIPQLWHSLHREAHLVSSLHTFKKCGKTELYRWAFNNTPIS